ncbi:MAG: hypothetical protein UR52_C0013G0008 [Candidatus Gottesmanbacteria bacterium GW2011_GWA1_34_13]|uniref:Nucleoside 2-deoxyribosyltransferase n=1 Tax=Candidatus Gottesmanbacteria bacterium GW2011_GWA1_34_13 TaxID=1618434 RepID=A0A0G0D7D4_9BACT|nr:MAG: hypothetical protein UR52_C0013G0008 [Candidatus Gottesmanbacteria bacterium GW2011_GWA1_34_13]
MARERLETLAEKDNLVYIYTRLFDFSEKLKAEAVEATVLGAINGAFEQRGLQVPSKTLTFVPFRDTRQDQIVAENKTKIIYEEDLKRLNRCALIVGFLDGLSKDEGVCLEIGYAYGKGVPIIAVFTDFIQSEYKGIPDSTHITDPVILAMLSGHVQNTEVAGGSSPFKDRLQASFQDTLNQLNSLVQETLLEPDQERVVIPEGEKIDVYIDIGGGQYEWERMMQTNLEKELTDLGYSVEVSKRNSDLNLMQDESIPMQERILRLGSRDIDSARNAKIVITCADMDEMSSGTAAIQGLARSLSKAVILLDTRTTDLVGDGGHRMSRNLMIDYSANVVARSYKEIPSFVKAFMDKRNKS